VTLEEIIIKIKASAAGVTATLDKVKHDVKGVESQAVQSKKGISGIFSGVGAGAGVAAAGLAAGAAVVATSTAKYASYGKEVKTVMRLTNASAEEASTIVGQMKLIGGESVNAGESLRRWAVNLQAARDPTTKQGKLMASLGVATRDASGAYLSGGQVFLAFRDAISGVSDASERAADLSTMMGRGYAEILPYFTKSKAEVGDYTKALKDMGMVMSENDMNTWGKFMGDQKMMDMLFSALQIKIARLVIPTLNALMPILNSMVGFLTKIPAPLIQIIAAFASFAIAVKMTNAAFVVGRNLIGMYNSSAGLIASIMGKAAVGEEVAAGSTETMTAAVGSQLAVIGALLIALAAVAAATYLIVKAYKSWKEAADQAHQAALGSKATDAKAQTKIDQWKAKHPGKPLPEGYQRLQEAINSNPKDYQAPKNVHEWARAALGGMWDNTYGHIIKRPQVDVDTKPISAKLDAARAQVTTLRRQLMARINAGNLNNGPILIKLHQAEQSAATLKKQLRQSTKAGPLDLSRWLDSIAAASASLQFFRQEVEGGSVGMPVSMHGPHKGKIPKLAGGADFVTHGAQQIIVGEAGEERVTVTPKGKARGGDTFNFNVANLHGTDERAAREFADRAMRHVMLQVRRGLAGQNA
jgi:hypothetical protein